jgi:phosphotransferase system HPr-like phosphotransfer protein
MPYEKEKKLKTLTVKIENVEQVKEFVNIVSACADEVDLEVGRYVVDAKSIMGIFSLDLTKPIGLKYYESAGVTTEESDAIFADFKEKIKEFVVDDAEIQA